MPAHWMPTDTAACWVLREALPSRQWHWSCWEPATLDPLTHEVVLQWPAGHTLFGAMHTRVGGLTSAEVRQCHARIRAADPLAGSATYYPDGTAVL